MKTKRELILALGLVGAVLCAGALPQDPEGGQDPIEALQEELAEVKAELASTRALLDETVLYLNEQAKGARDLLAVYQSAEEAGFTAGINYQSREILLAGWRKQVAAQQKGLPGAAPAPVAPAADAPRGRGAR